MEDVENLKKELSACVKCGACQSVCPVFLELKREHGVARGKFALFESLVNGEIEVTERFAEVMSQCVLCFSCKETCAAGIEIERLIPLARHEVLKKMGIPIKKKIALSILSSKEVQKKFLFSLLRIIDPLFLKKIPESSGLYYRFSFFLERGRFIPNLARKPFSEIYKKPLQGNIKKPKVLFFSGCIINFVYPNIGKSVIDILKKMDFTVIFPKNNNCCGFPAFASGDIKTSKETAETNLDEFLKEEFDAIVVGCASCGTSFKKIYDYHFKDQDNEKFSRWNEIKKKIFDISEFIIEFDKQDLSRNLPGTGNQQRVTYHDPCHLKKSQGIYLQPREIIANIAGLNFIEMEEASSCCGFGGTFSLENYKLSLKINDIQSERIISSNPSKVLTSCPGCIMQLQGGLLRHGSKIKVSHWAEEIAGLF